MHFEQNIDRDGIGTIALVHGEDMLVWTVSKLSKSTQFPMITRDINEYWSTLPAANLKDIWDSYVVIHSRLNSNLESKDLATALKDDIAELYTKFEYEPLKEWVLNKSRIKVPTDQLEVEYTVNAPNNKLTYLLREYLELLALTTYIKPLMGIFGTYVHHVDAIVGTEFKELNALMLLERSSVVDTAPYQRLVQYVTAILGYKDISMDALLKGLGSERVPDWLMAFAIVRRLPFSELPGADDDADAHNVVSNVYNYIDSKVKQMKKSFGNNVRDKKLRPRDDSSGGLDNGPSVAEIYKMTEEVSEGDVIDAEWSMRTLIDTSLDAEEYSLQNSNVRRVVHRIDATVPDALIELAEMYYRGRVLGDLAADNQHLERFVLNNEISRALIPLLGDNVANMAIVTCIVLWHWKLYDLAALATAERKKIPNRVFAGTTKLKLEPDQLTALERIYPIPVRVTTESRKVGPTYRPILNAKNSRRLLEVNQGEVTVAELSEFFSRTGWLIRVPPKLRTQCNFSKNQYGSVVPDTINQQLADMLIKLNEIGSL